MSEERAFLKAIQANPEDHTARLVYADWLDEHDDPRGELVRIEEEIPDLPLHSDRYWELKPRRRALLKSAKRPWLKQMGYKRGTDYQPVFADVPDGWKERWRLLREFVERWYRIPMADVSGPLKPVPASRLRSWDLNAHQLLDQAMSDEKASARVPPSVREWLFFIRELQLGIKDFGSGSGDGHHFWDDGERINFLQQDGGRDIFFVRDEDRHDPDPPVWEAGSGGRGSAQFVSPHVTTLALHYLLMQYEPEYGEHTPGAQKMAKPFARRLADAFPVRSHFDETQIYERLNVIVMWYPQSRFTSDAPGIHIKVRPPATEDEVYDALWE